jgi:hypothetical protein
MRKAIPFALLLLAACADSRAVKSVTPLITQYVDSMYVITDASGARCRVRYHMPAVGDSVRCSWVAQ